MQSQKGSMWALQQMELFWVLFVYFLSNLLQGSLKKTKDNRGMMKGCRNRLPPTSELSCILLVTSSLVESSQTTAFVYFFQSLYFFTFPFSDSFPLYIGWYTMLCIVPCAIQYVLVLVDYCC